MSRGNKTVSIKEVTDDSSIEEIELDSNKLKSKNFEYPEARHRRRTRMKSPVNELPNFADNDSQSPVNELPNFADNDSQSSGSDVIQPVIGSSNQESLKSPKSFSKPGLLQKRAKKRNCGENMMPSFTEQSKNDNDTTLLSNPEVNEYLVSSDAKAASEESDSSSFSSKSLRSNTRMDHRNKKSLESKKKSKKAMSDKSISIDLSMMTKLVENIQLAENPSADTSLGSKASAQIEETVDSASVTDILNLFKNDSIEVSSSEQFQDVDGSKQHQKSVSFQNNSTLNKAFQEGVQSPEQVHVEAESQVSTSSKDSDEGQPETLTYSSTSASAEQTCSSLANTVRELHEVPEGLSSLLPNITDHEPDAGGPNSESVEKTSIQVAAGSAINQDVTENHDLGVVGDSKLESVDQTVCLSPVFSIPPVAKKGRFASLSSVDTKSYPVRNKKLVNEGSSSKKKVGKSGDAMTKNSEPVLTEKSGAVPTKNSEAVLANKTRAAGTERCGDVQTGSTGDVQKGRSGGARTRKSEPVRAGRSRAAVTNNPKAVLTDKTKAIVTKSGAARTGRSVAVWTRRSGADWTGDVLVNNFEADLSQKSQAVQKNVSEAAKTRKCEVLINRSEVILAKKGKVDLTVAEVALEKSEADRVKESTAFQAKITGVVLKKNSRAIQKNISEMVQTRKCEVLINKTEANVTAKHEADLDVSDVVLEKSAADRIKEPAASKAKKSGSALKNKYGTVMIRKSKTRQSTSLDSRSDRTHTEEEHITHPVVVDASSKMSTETLCNICKTGREPCNCSRPTTNSSTSVLSSPRSEQKTAPSKEKKKCLEAVVMPPPEYISYTQSGGVEISDVIRKAIPLFVEEGYTRLYLFTKLSSDRQKNRVFEADLSIAPYKFTQAAYFPGKRSAKGIPSSPGSSKKSTQVSSRQNPLGQAIAILPLSDKEPSDEESEDALPCTDNSSTLETLKGDSGQKVTCNAPLFEWSCENVSAWLASHGLGRFVSNFSGVDGQCLIELIHHFNQDVGIIQKFLQKMGFSLSEKLKLYSGLRALSKQPFLWTSSSAGNSKARLSTGSASQSRQGQEEPVSVVHKYRRLKSSTKDPTAVSGNAETAKAVLGPSSDKMTFNTPLSEWTSENVCRWLTSLGLGRFIKDFQDVDGHSLTELVRSFKTDLKLIHKILNGISFSLPESLKLCANLRSLFEQVKDL